MENTQTNNNKIINEKCIEWVEKMSECLEVCTKSIGSHGKSSADTNKMCFEVCTKSIGCHGKSYGNTHKICKLNNLDNYNKLNKHFE